MEKALIENIAYVDDQLRDEKRVFILPKVTAVAMRKKDESWMSKALPVDMDLVTEGCYIGKARGDLIFCFTPDGAVDHTMIRVNSIEIPFNKIREKLGEDFYRYISDMVLNGDDLVEADEGEIEEVPKVSKKEAAAKKLEQKRMENPKWGAW